MDLPPYGKSEYYFHENRQAESWGGGEATDKRHFQRDMKLNVCRKHTAAGLPSRREPFWGFFPAEASSIDTTACM
jgi:hypothetical protein